MNFRFKEETVKAEICLALESLMSNDSYNSWSTYLELFMVMLNDSAIAKQCSVGKTKRAYYTNYRMAACFKDLFLENLKEIPFYSASFGKSYDNVIKQGQMDLHITYWNSKAVKSHCALFKSSLMGKSSANKVFEHFDFLPVDHFNMNNTNDNLKRFILLLT